jgi:hypothetical protein
MSIQDERELRGRLGGLLDSIEPVPAPVANAMRRGKVIRMRRWVSAALGVAVLAAGAVVLPGLIRGHHAPVPMAPRHYKVTVQQLGPTAKAGLVGVGTIDNKRWQIVLSKGAGDGCEVEQYLLTCGPNGGGAVGPRDVVLDDATAGATEFQLGNVGSDVTRVVIRLSDGSQLDLRPISAGGHRWIAFAAPLHAMVRAESFVGVSEYAYATPYRASTYTEFVTWLRPGQPGLPRSFAHVGSGVFDGVAWSTSVSIGPWGYCVAFANGGSCIPTATSLPLPHIGKPVMQLTCGPLFRGTTTKQIGASGVVFVPTGVKNVVIKFAGGSRMRLVATSVGGTRAIGYAIPNGPRVVRMLEYGFAGQLLGSVSGDGWVC